MEDLLAKSTDGMSINELHAHRTALRQRAQELEKLASLHWQAFWGSMGLKGRPLTAEQEAMIEKVKPVSAPRPPKPQNYVESFG